MNILISQIGSGYTDDWVADLLGKLAVDQCVVVAVGEALHGKVSTDVATYTIPWEECAYADYTFLKENNVPPIDDALLEQMAPYEEIVLWMLERRLGHGFIEKWLDYCEHIRMWNYLLDTMHIDLYMPLTVPHEGYDFIIYALCKLKGIHFFTTYDTHFLGYSYIVDDLYNHIPKFHQYLASLKEMYKDVDEEVIELNEELDSFFRPYYDGKSDVTPWYMDKIFSSKSIYALVKKKGESFLRKNDFRKEVFNMRTYIKAWNVIYRSKSMRSFKILAERFKFLCWGLTHIFSLNLKGYSRMELIANKKDTFREYEILIEYYNENAHPIDYTKKFIYVPLHMQPECTSSPLGGRFVDQLRMIQMLAYYLPEGYIIYVKEHPSQIWMEREVYAFRTLKFYEELLKVPNVRLVPFSENTYDLIHNSCAVASLIGTAGFEAVINNKPFLMFGYYLTQYAPGVFPIRSVSDCAEAMKRIENYEQDAKWQKKQVKIYFKALEKYIFKGIYCDDPDIVEQLPQSYWEDSKRIIVEACKTKIVEVMGEAVLK